jgi:hypothetical protein
MMLLPIIYKIPRPYRRGAPAKLEKIGGESLLSSVMTIYKTPGFRSENLYIEAY